MLHIIVVILLSIIIIIISSVQGALAPPLPTGCDVTASPQDPLSECFVLVFVVESTALKMSSKLNDGHITSSSQ